MVQSVGLRVEALNISKVPTILRLNNAGQQMNHVGQMNLYLLQPTIIQSK